MKFFLTCIQIILVSIHLYSAGKNTAKLDTDVCIIGAGSAGIGAALAASRSGANVILIEKESKVGGTSTMSYVNSWEPGPGCSFAEEIYHRMAKNPGTTGIARAFHKHMENNEPYITWLIDDTLKYNNTLRRKGGYRVPFDVDGFDGTVRQMLAETDKCNLMLNTRFTKAHTKNRQIKSIEAVSSDGKKYVIKAKVFIDCSGIAAVCRNVGCETMVGEDPQSRFGEPSAPEKAANSLNAISLCYQIKPAQNQQRPNTVNPQDSDCYAAAWVTGPVGPEKKLTINPYGIIEGKLLLTLDRDSLYSYGQKLIDRHWAKIGSYPFFKNYVFDSYAPRLGIRESYRVVCEYILTQHDLIWGLSQQKHNDLIALADHPMDIHGKGGGLWNLKGAYGIPYRCLVPIGWDNLLVAGKHAGFSHLAASSCRLSRTMMSLGHAAGFAASVAAKEGIPVQDVQVKRIKAEMNLKLHPEEKSGEVIRVF